MGFLNKTSLRFIIISGQMAVTLMAVRLSNINFKKWPIITAGLSFYLIGVVIIWQSSSDFCRERKNFIKILSLLRHDVMNHLQVIYSMIQLSKYNNVLNYINNVKESGKTISHICNDLTDFSWICCLLELFYVFRQKNIDLKVEVVNDNFLPQMTILKQEMENISCKLIRFKVKKR